MCLAGDLFDPLYAVGNDLRGDGIRIVIHDDLSAGVSARSK